MPEVHRPPEPASVRTAVKLMYAGAAASLAFMAIDLATLGTTKSDFEKRSPTLTASQATVLEHGLMAGAIIVGVIGGGLWIFMAQACRKGKSWAQTAATVLFGIATVELLLSALIVPYAVLVKIIALVVWLIGLGAVVLLRRGTSTAFFKGPRS